MKLTNSLSYHLWLLSHYNTFYYKFYFANNLFQRLNQIYAVRIFAIFSYFQLKELFCICCTNSILWHLLHSIILFLSLFILFILFVCLNYLILNIYFIHFIFVYLLWNNFKQKSWKNRVPTYTLCSSFNTDTLHTHGTSIKPKKIILRSPGEGNDNPLQYSSLGNSMDRGVW